MLDVSSLMFPVVAVSPAGWIKEAGDRSELTEVSPRDDLIEWGGTEIYDFSGRKFSTKAAYRSWPRSKLGLWLCRFANQSVHVGFHLDEPTATSVEELKYHLRRYYGVDHLTGLADAKTVQEVISLCL
jgi:hypothetical protein